MALPSWLYRDPLSVLLAREAQTCRGCKHSETLTICNEVRMICAKGKKHGKRCRSYQTK